MAVPTSRSGEFGGEVLRIPGFALFWSAATLRAFGGTIAGVAMQVVLVAILGADAAQVGLFSALGVVPYFLFGFVIGALMDRWRRQRTLVWASIGRALVLAIIPILLLTDTLTFAVLTVFAVVLGLLTMFTDSASQPLLPQLVPRDQLVAANARLGQSGTVAETAGPALGGVLISWLGAPLLFLIDAVISAIAAILQSQIRVDEPPVPAREPGRHLGHDIVEGMRFTYRHRTLRPLALSVHIWFLANALAATLFALYALDELALPAWAFALAVAAGGVGGLIGALIAPRLGARFGAGRAILAGRVLAVVPWVALAVLPLTPSAGVGVLTVVVGAAQLLYGLSMGIEDANDSGYRQAVAPDHLQGRMNATIRTVNRMVFFVGALLAGLLGTLIGLRWTFGIAAVIFGIAALVVLLSPLRTARHGDHAG
ncbi:MFS transporter [Microbacterium gorillae]|uniref:MFS transporter n=1 Tax=Microbacterium gorillae TaxID=1231063 RepID=UPI000694BD45|nr:MFS transporter [Microbacterium gorillae]